MVSVQALAVASLLIAVQAFRLKKARRSTCGALGVSDQSAQGNETGIQIVNGQPAAQCKWKWQVGLRREGATRTFCGGMLINDEWVLTAAHCAKTPNFDVVVGEHDLSKDSGKEQVRAAVQVFQHPEYDRETIANDFALVRLLTAVEFNDCVGSVCLPTEGADVPVGSECWITGWGTLSAGGGSPDVLQEAAVGIISNEACHKEFGYSESSIFPSMLCAQGRLSNGSVVDACQGDSGGPLVCETSPGRWAVYGATSWGRGCAGANFPGVWSRVHEAVGWIDQTLEENQGPPPEPVFCPDSAVSREPDADGDCRCKDWKKCSTDGGVTANCPTSSSLGSFDGYYFSPDCENCQCYATISR